MFTGVIRGLVSPGAATDGVTTDMYYLLDTVPPIRIECKNEATV